MFNISESTSVKISSQFFFKNSWHLLNSLPKWIKDSINHQYLLKNMLGNYCQNVWFYYSYILGSKSDIHLGFTAEVNCIFFPKASSSLAIQSYLDNRHFHFYHLAVHHHNVSIESVNKLSIIYFFTDTYYVRFHIGNIPACVLWEELSTIKLAHLRPELCI